MMKAAKIQRFEELNLGERLIWFLKCNRYEVSEVISAARFGKLKYWPGIGPRKVAEITKALDEAGLIFHESVQSQRVRHFLEVLVREKVSSLEEYEAQSEFSDQQIAGLLALIRSLPEAEAQVLNDRYGFEGAELMIFKDIGTKMGMSAAQVRKIESRARMKLRRPENIRKIKQLFPNLPGLLDL